jgi:hypothetical protein
MALKEIEVSEVVLFTNRNSLFLDNNGEQIPIYQRLVSWKPIEDYTKESEELEDLIKMLWGKKPKFYIAKWGHWREELTMDEWCSLIGKGPFYFSLKHKVERRINEY